EVRLLAFARIEFVAREGDHQVVALFFAPLEQSNMPVMEQVESSVRDDSSHCRIRPVISAHRVGRRNCPAILYHSVISGYDNVIRLTRRISGDALRPAARSHVRSSG